MFLPKECVKTFFAIERGWWANHEFDFSGKTLLGPMIPRFKLNFGNRLREGPKLPLMWKERERERERESIQRREVEPTLWHLILWARQKNTFSESTRNRLKFLCDMILAHSTWKSDLVRKQAAACKKTSSLLKSKQQVVLVACFTLLVSLGGLRKKLELSMLQSLCFSLRIYVLQIWMKITVNLKFETCCQFYLVVFNCVMSRRLWQYRDCIVYIFLILFGIYSKLDFGLRMALETVRVNRKWCLGI